MNLSWKDGSIIEKLKEMLDEYLKKTEPEYYPPVENLLDLIYEHYTENKYLLDFPAKDRYCLAYLPLR